MRKVLAKLIQWVFYGVLIGIAPIGVAFLVARFTPDEISITKVVSNGELLLVTAGIVGAAIGELLGGNHKIRELELVTGGFCVIILIFSSHFFAFFSIKAIEPNITKDSVVATCSYWLFGGGLISSICSVILSEL